MNRSLSNPQFSKKQYKPSVKMVDYTTNDENHNMVRKLQNVNGYCWKYNKIASKTVFDLMKIFSMIYVPFSVQ